MRQPAERVFWGCRFVFQDYAGEWEKRKNGKFAWNYLLYFSHLRHKDPEEYNGIDVVFACFWGCSMTWLGLVWVCQAWTTLHPRRSTRSWCRCCRSASSWPSNGESDAASSDQTRDSVPSRVLCAPVLCEQLPFPRASGPRHLIHGFEIETSFWVSDGGAGGEQDRATRQGKQVRIPDEPGQSALRRRLSGCCRC